MKKFIPVAQKIPAAETIFGGKLVYIALFCIMRLQIRCYLQDFFVNLTQDYLFFCQQQHSIVHQCVTRQIKFVGKTRFAQTVAGAFQQLNKGFLNRELA